MADTVLAVFEGTSEGPATDVDRSFLRVRRAAVLDVLEQAGMARGLDAVVLCTDDPELAEEAAALGAAVRPTARPFRFGEELHTLVRALRPRRLVLMGGGAAPLLQAKDLERWLGELEDREPLYAVNNPLSPDVVLVQPAEALLRLPPPQCDNQLGILLREAGLPRRLLPWEARLQVDLDTPTDALVLALAGEAAGRLGRVLAALPWAEARERLRRAVCGLLQPGGEVMLAGRVSPLLVNFLNTRFPVRTRVLSEERGMKALGREQRGEVRSFLALWMESAGIESVFQAWEHTCTAAFVDTRPLMAHGGRRIPARERFLSDVGCWQEIADPWLRAFTRRAAEAAIPVVLGGHTLVSAGLWYLAERLVQQELVAGASNG